MLPELGRPTEGLLAELDQLRAADGHGAAQPDIHAAQPVSHGDELVIDAEAELLAGAHEAAMAAYSRMSAVDCLDPGEAPSVVALERSVVAAVAARLGGDHRTPGIFTGGGTESIMLAVKSARDRRPDIARPELVVPVTAHAAFHKAADYLGLGVRMVDVDPRTCLLDPADVASAMTAQTVLVGVSAPGSSHGVVDPVAVVAGLAASRGVSCHVDACVGGWVLPWLAMAGAPTPAFDLSVPGVTSISCDLHKFGASPKSASLVLFADEQLRRAAYHACARWTGYAAVTPTVQSGRSAGLLAGTWASLQYTGAAGHVALARSVLAALGELTAGLADIPALRILGDPVGPIVALASATADIDIFCVADEARLRGVSLGLQLGNAGLPPSLRVNLATPGASKGVAATVLALRDAVDAVDAVDAAQHDRGSSSHLAPGPVGGLSGGLFGGLSGLEDGTDADFAAALRSMGLFNPPETALVRPGEADWQQSSRPPATASINRLLDALPPLVREQLMLRYTSVLYSHHLG